MGAIPTVTKVTQTGMATRTLTWIAHIHSQSHTDINAVTSTTPLCDAPAQLITEFRIQLLQSFYFRLKSKQNKVLAAYSRF